MQGGLVSHWTGEDGVAVFGRFDGRAIKPILPSAIQTPFDPNVVVVLSVRHAQTIEQSA